MQTGESLLDAINRQLLWEVQQGHTKSNGKKFLVAVRPLEKFR